MSICLTIAKRELKSLFVSPVAYLILSFFAFISGFHFLLVLRNFDDALQQAQVQAQLMRNPDVLSQINVNGMLIVQVVSFAFFLLLFAVPFMTMGLLSRERDQGTYELLMTSPITTTQILIGKFLSGLALLGLMLATHLVFLFVVFAYGNPEPGPVIAGYLGLLLAGGAFMAVGLFASSLTRHQFIAAGTTFFLLLIMLMIGWAGAKTSGNIAKFLEAASVTTQFETYVKGLITVSGAVYFVSVWVFFLAASRVAMQSLTRN